MKKILIILLTLLHVNVYPQVSNYSYLGTTSTWVTNVSPTILIGSGQDDAISAVTNIGFNFVYDNITYSQYRVSSNGFLTFKTTNTSTQATNNLKTSTERVILAVLWDDNKTGGAGNVNYKLTGISPNQILTIEWRALRWVKANWSSGTISCQIKLYQTTNIIEYIYDKTATSSTYSLTTNPTSSIGLGGATSGDFLSLSDIKASPYPTSSSITETSTIGTTPMGLISDPSLSNDGTNNKFSGAQLTTRIGDGTKYRFTPVFGLPIELLYFDASENERYNHLTWSTASETNNDYFNIEKTQDGVVFYNIVTMNGAGNSNTQNFYEYDDYDLNDNVTYYRLKQTDYDGKFKHHDIISVDNSKKIRIVVRIINLYGTEVDLNTKGVLILIYEDGTVKKIFNE